MATFGARVRGLLSGILGPSVGALPWIGDRPGIVGPALAPTTPTAALALTALYRCCSLLADAVALQPPAIYTADPKGGRIKQVGTAAARALATITYRDAEVFAFGAALTGNGFLRVLLDGTGAPSSLIGVPPWRVSLIVDERAKVFYKIAADATIGEAEVTIPESQMVHTRFRAIGANRLWGIPPAATCSDALGLALASRDVQKILFRNLSRPGGVLSAPGKIAPEFAKQMQSAWDQNYSGTGSGKVAVLSNGLTYTSVLWNAVDAQLLDQVKASADDISNCFGVPTNFISSTQHLTHASASEATKSLVLNAVKPFVSRCGDALSQTLLSRNDIANGATVDYDLTSTLLPPGAEMATFVATLVAGGVMTPNEARNTYLNLPDHPDGDALRTPTAPATPTPQPAKEPA